MKQVGAGLRTRPFAFRRSRPWQCCDAASRPHRTYGASGSRAQCHDRACSGVPPHVADQGAERQLDARRFEHGQHRRQRRIVGERRLLGERASPFRNSAPILGRFRGSRRGSIRRDEDGHRRPPKAKPSTKIPTSRTTESNAARCVARLRRSCVSAHLDMTADSAFAVSLRGGA